MLNYTYNETWLLLEDIDALKLNVDAFFLITNSFLVCLMQCGFACLEAGSIRSKNATNILMKNFLDMFISCIGYWLIGYAVAYGDGNSFIGGTYFAGIDVPDEKMPHWFFQFIFAATAATIVSGAMAERCHFATYIVYSFTISGFIYPVATHWMWTDDGWLTSLGYYDFAGSGGVHLLGGTAALVGAYILGPRSGRFEGENMSGHSTPLMAIGGMLLTAGFLAFNGGSLGNVTSDDAGGIVARVIANTMLSGAASGVVTMFAGRVGLLGEKTWNFSLTLNATLAGMVAICATVDKLTFWSSFVTGAIASPVFIGVHYLMIFLKVDDPLDAVAVHLGGGLWGLLSGPFLRTDGMVYGITDENSMNILYNLAGACAIFLWTGGLCLVMFLFMKTIKCLRVSQEDETTGLDITKHKEAAYTAICWIDNTKFIIKPELRNGSTTTSLDTLK